MVWSENICVMLLNHEKGSIFTAKQISNAKSKIAVLFALSLYIIEEVNKLLTRGLNAGGIEPNEMRD
jgi:predicted lactoylglutathione lyase